MLQGRFTKVGCIKKKISKKHYPLVQYGLYFQARPGQLGTILQGKKGSIRIIQNKNFVAKSSTIFRDYHRMGEKL